MATEAQASQPPPDNSSSSDNANSNAASNPPLTTTSSEPQQEATQQPKQQPAPPPPQSSSTEPNPQQQQPASPPLPPPPTAIAPGPRATRFQEMFDRTLTHTLAKISPDNFAACYPTIAARAPHVLRQVQRGMVDRLAQLSQQEFTHILERYAVVARLNELEALVADASLRTKKTTQTQSSRGAAVPPPHMLPAEAVLAAHLAPQLASAQSQMNARLQNTQAANAVLWEAVGRQRDEVEGLLGALEAALRDVEGAAGLMDAVPAEELARESRAVEAEMMDDA